MNPEEINRKLRELDVDEERALGVLMHGPCDGVAMEVFLSVEYLHVSVDESPEGVYHVYKISEDYDKQDRVIYWYNGARIHGDV